MRFHADVQIHSKYSRATSKNADLENIALWARKKGITVVGTGDFTHPLWLREIKEKLVPAEPGLFRLRPEIEEAIYLKSPRSCANDTVRFMLEVEISTIYKKGDKVRKIHHLIFVPTLEAADKLVASLSKIGNLASDGRPILGLDSRNLLEITLATSDYSYLIPAHIWTPWFAALGSKSGFDSIDECYGDLAQHVFAVETGLSSDPPMNWRIASLDRFTLVSNSDAHSPGKIAREATTYDTDLDYFAILRALKTTQGLVGTVEFFPEEGKYHLDGHRNCKICFAPRETLQHKGLCPVCNNPLTIGVAHRIASLADRSEEEARKNPPPRAKEVLSLIPLPEILSEILDVGVNSKRVTNYYEQLLDNLGSELAILETVPLEELARKTSPIFTQAIERLRCNKVIRQGGYDGEYGVIRLFTSQELRSYNNERLFTVTQTTDSTKTVLDTTPAIRDIPIQIDKPVTNTVTLDEMQKKAVAVFTGPLLVLAGPGSGKTRVLTHRIAHLITHHKVAPEKCLAITFTRRAAHEMHERLSKLLPTNTPPVHTFHSLALHLLSQHIEKTDLKTGFTIVNTEEQIRILMTQLKVSYSKAKEVLKKILLTKTGRASDEVTGNALSIYENYLYLYNAVDYDGLILRAIKLLQQNEQIACFSHVCVNEYQDIDSQQYVFMRLLAPHNICVIGDPNQAIYGFRGADTQCFTRFHQDYKNVQTISLYKNYRSSETIITASHQVITQKPRAITTHNDHITLHKATSERGEGEFIVHTIEQLLGGHNLFSLDSQRSDGTQQLEISFSDIAVLYRTTKQGNSLREAFMRSGLPFKTYTTTPLTEDTSVKKLLSILEEQDKNLSLIECLQNSATFLIKGGEEKLKIYTALEQLLTLANTCDNNYERFTQELFFATQVDTLDPRAQNISLLTLHAAKGLEFVVVFIAGVREGLIPLYFHPSDSQDMPEERRLFYVGITRAKNKLFLSYVAKPSRFLDDISPTLLKSSNICIQTSNHTKKQLKLF